MKKHFDITIRGQVQGVYYRGSAKKMADQIGIFGFVRNEPNGDVYCEAEGDEEKLSQFVNWCKYGPERAEVKEVIVNEDSNKNFTTFEVRR